MAPGAGSPGRPTRTWRLSGPASVGRFVGVRGRAPGLGTLGACHDVQVIVGVLVEDAHDILGRRDRDAGPVRHEDLEGIAEGGKQPEQLDARHTRPDFQGWRREFEEYRRRATTNRLLRSSEHLPFGAFDVLPPDRL